MLSVRYKKGIFALLWISLLLMIPFFLTVFGFYYWNVYASLAFPSIFIVIAFITFLFGISEPGKVNSLFEKKALIKWAYSSEEWKFIMQKQKKEQKNDWKIILAFFIVLSFIISILISLATKNILFSSFVFGAGVVFGSGLSLINHLCDLQEYKSKSGTPGKAAIGEGEFYFNDIYFKDNPKGSFFRKEIKDARLAVIEHKKYLMITTREQRFSRFGGMTKSIQTYKILTPDKEYRLLEDILPRIASKE